MFNRNHTRYYKLIEYRKEDILGKMPAVVTNSNNVNREEAIQYLKKFCENNMIEMAPPLFPLQINNVDLTIDSFDMIINYIFDHKLNLEDCLALSQDIVINPDAHPAEKRIIDRLWVTVKPYCRTEIFSSFSGTGKSFFFEKLQEKLGIVVADSDSSKFSKLEDGNTNPDFPNNYIKHITSLIGKVDIIFISTHETVRQALKEKNIKYNIVYPHIQEKERYLRRYLERGSSPSFIQFMRVNWESFLHQISNDEYPTHHQLPIGNYYIDHVVFNSFTN